MDFIKSFGKLFVGLTISSILILTLPEMNGAYTQPMSTSNNSTAQQHAEHTLDNLVTSEHIPLTGRLAGGDYILLMDFTPLQV
jgi:hypothetical protein